MQPPQPRDVRTERVAQPLTLLEEAKGEEAEGDITESQRALPDMVSARRAVRGCRDIRAKGLARIRSDCGFFRAVFREIRSAAGLSCANVVRNAHDEGVGKATGARASRGGERCTEMHDDARLRLNV